jgi:hypothetical protein
MAHTPINKFGFVPTQLVAPPGWTYAVITDAVAHQIKTGSGIFGGLISTGVQNTPCNVCDGTDQTGPLLFSAQLTNAGPSGGIYDLENGIAFTTGLNFKLIAGMVGTILVLYL